MYIKNKVNFQHILGLSGWLYLYLLNIDWFAEDVKTLVSSQALGYIPEKEPELSQYVLLLCS